jgi:hypothetical protein
MTKSERMLFARAGEVGALLRSVNWADTSLGPVARWPSALQHAVTAIMESPWPTTLMCGPDLLQIYNQAFARLIGDRHPAALAAPLALVWPDDVGRVAAVLDDVRRTGARHEMVDEVLLVLAEGRRHERFVSATFSPIRDANDRVIAVLNQAIDTTQRVLGQRRLNTLRDLALLSDEDSTPADTCHQAIAVLARNREDLIAVQIMLYPNRRAATLLIPPARTPAPGSTRGSETRWDVRLDLPTSPGAPTGQLLVAVNPRLPFDEGYRGFLELVAAQIAMNVSTAHVRAQRAAEAEQLTQALQTNRVIGTAMGVLMAMQKITDEQAFARLRTISQNSNRKLRDVAEEVVRTGALPPGRPPRGRSDPR